MRFYMLQMAILGGIAFFQSPYVLRSKSEKYLWLLRINKLLTFTEIFNATFSYAVIANACNTTHYHIGLLAIRTEYFSLFWCEFLAKRRNFNEIKIIDWKSRYELNQCTRMVCKCAYFVFNFYFACILLFLPSDVWWMWKFN